MSPLSHLLLQLLVFHLHMRRRLVYQSSELATPIASVAQTAFALARVFVQGIVSPLAGAEMEKEYLARILTQSWSNKGNPFLLKVDTTLSRQLILGGVGGIAWNNLKRRQIDSKGGPQKELESIYRSLAIQETQDQIEIIKIGRRLWSAGISPLSFKGRVLSNYYTPTHIRPTGDLDIIVPESQFDAAIECLTNESVTHELELNDKDHVFSVKCSGEGHHLRVDLHKDLSRFGFESTEEVFNSSVQASQLDPLVFRMPGLEHHIRIVTIHFLRHGGWRPLWLCDIAALMEVIDSGFDWNLCLGYDPVYAEWVVLAMKLAEQILGARTLEYPDKYQGVVVPDWMVDSLNKEWCRPEANRFRRPRFSDVSGLGNQLKEIGLRWPNPFVAMTSSQRSLLSGSVFLRQSECFWKRCRRYLFT